MLQLSTGEKYTFEVDGKPYLLAALTFDAIDEVVAIMSVQPERQAETLREFFEKRADKRTMAVIGKLTIRDIRDLFNDWAGVAGGAVPPGESGRSPGQ